MSENSNTPLAVAKVYPIITDKMRDALRELQEPNGMHETYVSFIKRIETLLLTRGYNLDLDDSAILSYLRILHMLRQDIDCLGKPEDHPDFSVGEGEEDNL